MANALQIAGAVAISAGAWLLLPAVGLIVGGGFCILFGLALTRPWRTPNA